MKTYKITSTHDVYIDSFNEGEKESVDSYYLSDEIRKDNVNEAIEDYIKNSLYFNYHKELTYKEDNKIYLSVLVDEDNTEANEKQIEQWKNNKLTLYINYVELEVYELVRVEL